MPCFITIRVVEARGLPVMDQSTGLADAFVEVRCGKETKQTDVKRKDLNPLWDTTFVFQVNDTAVLYEAPIEFRVIDHDKLSKGDSIGVVRLDITNVLLSEGTTSIEGWFPIYDTLKGIRGNLNIKIKARFTRNENQFKQKDTAGVRFITTSDPTSVYRISKIYRFVEELVVEADPEHQGAESFRIVGESRRSARLSNEQRLNTLYRLSGKLQQQIGLKVVTMGGNAVLGYSQEFDFECVGGIIARGYGTACKIKPKLYFDPPLNTSGETSLAISPERKLSKNNKPTLFVPPQLPTDVTILTIRSFSNVIQMRLAGIVSVRAVKLLKSDKVLKHRDKWWSEVRTEIKSHASALGCNYIIGYSETTSIHGDTCVVSASGTACHIPSFLQVPKPISRSVSMEVMKGLNPQMPSVTAVLTEGLLTASASSAGNSVSSNPTPSTSFEDNTPTNVLMKKKEKREKKRKEKKDKKKDGDRKRDGEKKKKKNLATPTKPKSTGKMKRKASVKEIDPICSYVHTSGKHNGFAMKTVLCAICKKKYVPEMLFSTIEIPPGLPIIGQGALLQAKVCLEKRTTAQGEHGASGISDMIPFLEYDLHRHLVFKLKIKGMNAIFGLRYQMSIGPTMVVGTATGTGVFVSCLPQPPPFQTLKIIEGSVQSHIIKQANSNRDYFKNLIDKEDIIQKKTSKEEDLTASSDGGTTDPDDSANEDPLQSGETAFIVEMDDEIDDESLRLLTDLTIPDNYAFCNTQVLPSAISQSYSNIQMIQLLTRAKLPTPSNKECSVVFDSIYAKLLRRLRGMQPCVISGINLDVQQYDENELTLILTAMAMLVKEEKGNVGDEELFAMEDDPDHHHHHHHHHNFQHQHQHHSAHHKEHVVPKVTLTPLSFVPDSTTEYYYGRINLHFIQEVSLSGDLDMGAFLHRFISAVNASARANVEALGGNALLGYRFEEFIITKNQNQGYALASMSGDAVHVHHHCDSEGFKKLS
eukprot:TRINITY_DN5210_c1_g1_i2.p1 TRINITY_DN5210_c1_g1~~TRINITY_DN5210_c1_g1_i2.p1  ORF type:complete len:983 (-),score=198.93 TRINITY_DN5210_c1_g1_i2:102-3050(-)